MLQEQSDIGSCVRRGLQSLLKFGSYEAAISVTGHTTWNISGDQVAMVTTAAMRHDSEQVLSDSWARHRRNQR